MTITTLTTYLLTAMTTWVPAATHPEGAEKAMARYESIARDIATVALDEGQTPLFAGADGREKTALLLASIASFESFFRADVDEGRARGDNGGSYCLMQIQVGTKTAEGWTGKDLIASRHKCLVAGLNRIRESFVMCRALPQPYRLAGYTCGRCVQEPKAEQRMNRAIKWLAAHPLPQEPDPKTQGS
jgi:hypothetical protein